jgi:transaldolase/glucose-6-phosphate isomerase
MIKVPASIEGLPAIRQLTSEGINVNITLLFGIERYDAVAQAYRDGLSEFVRRGGDPGRVSSVASFFVSRIDTMVDEMITTRLAVSTDPDARALLTSLLGKVAIANAKLAYQHYLAVCRSSAWQALAAKGARPQRLLWASTSTKNPRYRDVRYVEELIGRDTVNTMTPATIEAFRDHGQLRAGVEADVEGARQVMERLNRTGISLEAVTDHLLEDGVTQFTRAFGTLLTALGQDRASDWIKT